MLPEGTIRAALAHARRRLIVAACVNAALAGAATAAIVRMLGASRWGAAAAGVLLIFGAAAWAWRYWTGRRVALFLEREHPSLQNLVLTAQEALEGRPIHPVLSRELLAQAAGRLNTIDRPGSGALSPRRALLSAAGVLAAAVFIGQPVERRPEQVTGPGTHSGSAEDTAAEMALQVTVTPPSYSRLPAVTLDNPVQVDVLEGSTLRLRVTGTTSPVRLVEPGREPQLFAKGQDGAELELRAVDSRVYLVGPVADGSQAAPERLLQVQVRRDERPVVTIERPGRDLLFAAPEGTVPIRVTARDDLNVASIALRYTHVTGSGETFTFEEGELPLQVTPSGVATERHASGALVLDGLKLQEGDTLVYRAIARDDKPGADPVSSGSFVIEIGKQGEAASSGYSLPEDRDRQGLSQQMLILKTEKLNAARGQMSAEDFLEQSRLLAVEQRMVRAEFVFLTGGEVVDEVEEAEHSHELAAGRFENAAQIELFNAIREMSRAEARLNDADTAQALVFERAALDALQRAFDRRRYFLRTLPERSRIDPSRRLSGDVSTAKPVLPTRHEPSPDPEVQALRDAIALLSEALAGRAPFDANLAAKIMALAPGDPDLQQAAIGLATDRSDDGRRAAAARVQEVLTRLLRARLGPAAGSGATEAQPPSAQGGRE